MLCSNCKKEINVRTNLQNRSLHKYFELLAKALDDAGYDVKTTIREDLDIPWSDVMVKELIWRKVQQVYKKVNSTTKLKREDVSNIYEIVNRELANRTGVSVPFPNKDNLLLEEENYATNFKSKN